MRFTVMFTCLLLVVCMGLPGCLDLDGDDGESVVGLYAADTIGPATTNNDDILLEMTLISSDMQIKFAGSDEHKNCTNSQDPSRVSAADLLAVPCSEYFGFGIEKLGLSRIGVEAVLNIGCHHDNYKVGYYTPGDNNSRYESSCIIIEDVVDGIWSVGETIVLKENVNETGVCDASCTFDLTIVSSYGGTRGYISINDETYSVEHSIN